MGKKGDLSEVAERMQEKSSSAQKQEAKAGQEPKHRFTADIPKSLHKRLRLQSVEEERPMKEILVDALNDYLNE